MTQYVPPEEIGPYFSGEQTQQFGNYTVFGQEIVEDWAVGSIFHLEGK